MPGPCPIGAAIDSLPWSSTARLPLPLLRSWQVVRIPDRARQVSGKVPQPDPTLTWLRDEEAAGCRDRRRKPPL